jgi:E3 SUMO-protein ligase PIAS1
VDQVTIEPDGKWLAPNAQNEGHRSTAAASSLEDDDFVISEVSLIGGQGFETPIRSIQSNGTPSTAISRESSTIPRSATSSKRPIAQVIDLTLSSDEDDQPIAKRQQTTTSSGFNGTLSLDFH